MENNYRRYSDDVEAQARLWRDSAFELSEHEPSAESRWLEVDGLSCMVKKKGRFLENEHHESAKIGLATEKIVADLGIDLGVPVAPGTLLQPYADQPDVFWYLSLNPYGGDGPIDYNKNAHIVSAELYPEEDPQNAKSKLFHDLAAQNTALWVFYTWIGDVSEHQGRGDNYLLATQEGNKGAQPVLSGIDHAGAELGREKQIGWARQLKTPFRSGGYEVPPLDQNAGREMVQRILGYSQDDIEEIVYRTPDALLSPARKQRAVEGLMASKDNLERTVERLFSGYGDGATLFKRQRFAMEAADSPEILENNL